MESPESLTDGGNSAGRWHWAWLAGAIGGAAVLHGSWLLDSTRLLWDHLEFAVFSLFNASLGGPRWWQIMWAAANHRLLDVAAALYFASLYLAYVKAGPPGLRVRRLAGGVFIALYTVFVMYASNHWLWDIKRPSPTLVVDGAHRLSQLVPWIDAKDASGGSFPGDHGAALILFTYLIWYNAGRRFGLLALLGAVVFVWPRLVGGAHWLTDVAVGSTVLGGVSVAIAIATPLESTASNQIAKGLERLSGLGWRRRHPPKRARGATYRRR